MLVNQVTPAECNGHFGLKLHTQEGAWIQMTPSPKAIPAPLQQNILNHNVSGRHHQDMSSGGLYSSEELRAWQTHLEQGVTHSAVLERLTTGVCIERGQCQVTGMPSIHLNRLESISNFGSWMSGWETFMETLQQYSALLCVIVLLLEALKMSVFISVIAQSLVQGSIAEARALVYLMFCRAQRLQRLHRQTAASAPDGETQEVSLDSMKRDIRN